MEEGNSDELDRQPFRRAQSMSAPVIKMNDVLEAAEYYTSRGWKVLPVHHPIVSPIGVRCSCWDWKTCSDIGKHPRNRHGSRGASNDKTKIKRWWTGSKQTNIGIATGAESGLVVLDVDPRHSGLDTLRELVAKHGSLPGGPRCRTGGGGLHYFFKHPGSYVGNSSSQIGRGLDIRGEGGYVVAPPSKHRSGKSYTWEVSPDVIPLPALPKFLLLENTTVTERLRDGVTEIKRDREPEAISASPTLEYESTVQQAILETLPTAEGQRNQAIFQFARRLKALPQYADAETKQLKHIVREWHRQAYAAIGTKRFDDTWADFCRAWPAVRFPAGTDPLYECAKRADAADDPPCARDFDCPKTRRLIKICRELQGNGEMFFLGCRSAGSLLDIDHNSAANRLNMLVADGILALHTKGVMRRASRYRYIGHRAVLSQ